MRFKWKREKWYFRDSYSGWPIMWYCVIQSNSAFRIGVHLHLHRVHILAMFNSPWNCIDISFWNTHVLCQQFITCRERQKSLHSRCGRPTARTLAWLITAFGVWCRNESTITPKQNAEELRQRLMNTWADFHVDASLTWRDLINVFVHFEQLFWHSLSRVSWLH